MIAPHVRLSQAMCCGTDFVIQELSIRKDSVDKHIHTVKHLRNKNTGINFNLSIQ